MLEQIEKGKLIPIEKFEEKIGDIITYFFLQEALMLDSGCILQNEQLITLGGN